MENIDQIRELATAFRTAILSTDKEDRFLSFKDFPRGSCGDASLLLGTLLEDRGFGEFTYVNGTIGSHKNGTWRSHGWLEQGALIVDITADQFSGVDYQVMVTTDSHFHGKFEPYQQPHRAHMSIFEWPCMDGLNCFYAILLSRLEQIEGESTS